MVQTLLPQCDPPTLYSKNSVSSNAVQILFSSYSKLYKPQTDMKYGNVIHPDIYIVLTITHSRQAGPIS